jgi:hypothetical protein
LVGVSCHQIAEVLASDAPVDTVAAHGCTVLRCRVDGSLIPSKLADVVTIAKRLQP